MKNDNKWKKNEKKCHSIPNLEKHSITSRQNSNLLSNPRRGSLAREVEKHKKTKNSKTFVKNYKFYQKIAKICNIKNLKTIPWLIKNFQ